MIGSHLNKAEAEYAIMLAALNFQTAFMKSRHSRATVHLHEHLIEITLTGTEPVPAELCLAESDEGRSLLRQSHAELFLAGEPLLRRQLERDLGLTITQLFSHLDPASGATTIIAQLANS